MSSEQQVLQISSSAWKNGLYLVFTVQCHLVRTLLQVPRGVGSTVVRLGFLPLRMVAQQRALPQPRSPPGETAACLSFQGVRLQALQYLPMSVHSPGRHVGRVSV